MRDDFSFRESELMSNRLEWGSVLPCHFYDAVAISFSHAIEKVKVISVLYEHLNEHQSIISLKSSSAVFAEEETMRLMPFSSNGLRSRHSPTFKSKFTFMIRTRFSLVT